MEKKYRTKNHLILFSSEIIKETSEHHYWAHSIRSQVLYSSTLLSLIVIIVALRFLDVDVSVKSIGILRPAVDLKVLTSPVSGRVVEFKAGENETISKGALIIKVESPLLDEKLTYNSKRQDELVRYILDLKMLLQLGITDTLEKRVDLKTPIFQRSQMAFQEEVRKLLRELKNVRRLNKRRQYLYEKGVISLVELEKSKFDLDTVQSKYRLMYERRIGEWETKLLDFQNELDELKAEQRKLLEEKRRYKMYMPVKGTVQNLAGITEGSYVHTNQQLAEISPDTILVVECYVTPRDVGLLQEGMEGIFQVEAFDYNHWGTITGRITDISNDVLIKKSQPYFRVHSALDRSYLELQNGYRGYLKKGMTVRARFKVIERSLFQLLYDNVDDWLNPSQSIASKPDGAR